MLKTVSSNNTCTIVKAKRLVVVLPRILVILATLGLDEMEADVFSRVSSLDQNGTLVRYSGFPVNAVVANTGFDTKASIGCLANSHTITQSMIEGLIGGADFNKSSP